MDSFTAKAIELGVAEPNPIVMNGMAGETLKKAEEYLNEVFKAIKTFPEELEYLGYERCTPLQEAFEVTKPKNNKRTYDLAKSTIYLTKFKFAYKGKPLLERHIYLPYTEDAGVMYLGGGMFHIVPVLSDKVITNNYNVVFLRLLRDKMIVRKLHHFVFVNGVRYPDIVVYADIYRTKDTKVQKTTKAVTCFAHYLFAQYGLTETFIKFLGFKPILGKEEINSKNYPTKDWSIISCSGVKPNTCLDKVYETSTLRMAIPKDKWDSNTKSLVMGFFYIVDHFPDRFTDLDDTSYLDNPDIWKVLLGHIVFSGVFAENKLYQDIEEHFTSLSDYLDPMAKHKLKCLGYDVNNIYELFALVAMKFKDFTGSSNNSRDSLYNKNIEVLYWTLYNITASIFKTVFKLRRRTQKKDITEKDIIEIFNKELRTGIVFSLSSGKVVTETVDYSGDHKFIDLTSKMNEQESMPSNDREKANKRLNPGPAMYVNPYKMEVGQVLYLSKSNPDPLNRINPYLNLDPVDGTIRRNEDLRELLEATEKRLLLKD